MGDFAAWYRRDDYERIRRIMDDGNKLPPTFDEWEKTAKGQVASAAAAGFILKTVILDPDEFIAFCDRKGLPRSSQARALFAIERGMAKGMD